MKTPNVVSFLLLLFLSIVAGIGASAYLYGLHYRWWSVLPVSLLPACAVAYWCWHYRKNPVEPAPDDEKFEDAKRLLQERSGGKTVQSTEQATIPLAGLPEPAPAKSRPVPRPQKDLLQCNCGEKLDFHLKEVTACERCGMRWRIAIINSQMQLVEDNATVGYTPVGQDC